MAFIETTPPGRAEGKLRKLYEAAIQRAGRVYKIVQVQSPNPDALASSMHLYRTLMFGESPLTRIEREALAVVTSRANDCFY